MPLELLRCLWNSGAWHAHCDASMVLWLALAKGKSRENRWFLKFRIRSSGQDEDLVKLRTRVALGQHYSAVCFVMFGLGWKSKKKLWCHRSLLRMRLKHGVIAARTNYSTCDILRNNCSKKYQACEKWTRHFSRCLIALEVSDVRHEYGVTIGPPKETVILTSAIFGSLRM